MLSPTMIGDLLSAAFRPRTEPLPQSFAALLDRLEALDTRPVAVPGSLSDREIRGQIEEILAELRAYGRSLTRNYEEADDLVQETVLKAWAARDRFQAGTSFRAWTFVILRNHFLSNKRRARFQGDWDEIGASKLLAGPAVQEHGINLSDVVRALETINPHQRQALMLVTVGDMSHEEAASIMGVAVGTMKSRVSRA